MADVYRDAQGEIALDGGVVEEVFKLRKQSIKHQADWRREAQEDYEFRDGNQWDSEDVAVMELQQRPIVTFNRCQPIIDSVVGNEIGNRQEVRYFPRTMGDREPNEVYSEGARWVRQSCDAEDEESEMYRDSITCGMGWVEYRVDYDEDPEGQIVIERVPPLEMRWDPNSRRQNLADAKWLLREKWWDLDDVYERWPDLKGRLELGGPEDSSETEFMDEHDSTTAWQYKQDQRWWDEKARRVKVLQFQRKERAPFYRVAGLDQVEELTETEFKRLTQRMEIPEERYIRVHRFTYKQCFIAGRTLAEEGKPAIEGFTFFCTTGKRDEEEGTWFGLMRAMKDPQRWANKFFSTAQYIFSVNAKGGLLAEGDAVDDKREFEDSWARPDSVNWVTEGSLAAGKIQQKDFGGYPASLDKLLQFAVASIRDVSGVNLELLGMANREQPGVLEVERKKAALVILAPLLSSLRRYRKISGRALLEFMRTYIEPGTMMRITDRQVVEFMPDDSVVKYDVVVDTAPNSPNLKQEVWGQLGQMVPAMVKAGVPIPPQLVRFSPLPESVAEEWIQYMENAGQVDPELQKQLEELQRKVVDLEGENKQLQDKREMNMLTLQQKRDEMLLEQQSREQELVFEARKAEQELLFKAKMSEADRETKLIEIRARYDTEMTKIQEGVARERDRVEGEMELERIKAEGEIALERERSQAESEERVRQDFPRLEPRLAEIMSGKVEPLSAQLESIGKAVEAIEKLAEQAQERREIILSYLKDQGGEAAQVARRLN